MKREHVCLPELLERGGREGKGGRRRIITTIEKKITAIQIREINLFSGTSIRAA